MSAKRSTIVNNNNVIKADDNALLEEKFVHLCRLALQGRQSDIAAMARQTLRRIEGHRPDLHSAIATTLDLADGGVITRKQMQTPTPVDSDSRIDLLRTEFPIQIEREPQWPANVSDALNAIVRERAKETELRAAGIAPSKSMLFVGPPGVGKTLAARWLARETGRPLFILDLASVMNSLLGKTGTNLRTIMDFAKRQKCVLLLDEFDALAKRRDDDSELGELKRLVTVLIQELDAWPDDNLLVCATNHPGLLDPAIWRRFDVSVEFPKPSTDQIAALIRERLGSSAPQQSAGVVAQLLTDKSYADVDRMINAARRRSIVDEIDLERALLEIVAREASNAPAEQRVSIGLKLMRAGLSQRQASTLTGVARDTFRKHEAKPPKRSKSGKKSGAV